MNRKMKTEKMILLFSVIALMAALPVFSHAEEAGIRPRLVKSVTEYDMDYETNEWVPARTWDITYENDYPVSIDLYEIDADMHVITSFTYVFEDGIPTERKTYDSDNSFYSVTEYNNGRPYNVYEENDFHRSSLFYQYGNGDGYFTLVLRDTRNHDAEADISNYAEEVDAVSVTVRNGLLEKTVNTGMYANWGNKEEKEWMRFSGTYTAEYDDDGIVKLTSVVHRAGPSGIENRYELTKEGGLVTEGVCYIPEDDGSWMGNSRFTFAYTDSETSSARYAQMINSFLMGTESSYYKYNWY